MPKKEPLFSFFCITDKGNKRAVNEDSYLVDKRIGLWVLADGMGGYGSGDVASQIAVKHIVHCCQNGSSLVDSVYSSHRAVLCAAEAGRGVWGMGTTVVALRVIGCDYEVAWVGDSRAYLCKDNKMVQITKDHSMVQEMIDRGEISEKEAIDHPERNVISQALGSPDMDEIRVDTVMGQLSKGCSILLCSDGLTSEVSDANIADIALKDLSAEAKVEKLINAALTAGGKDNVTAILIENKKQRKMSTALKKVFNRLKITR